MEYPKTENLYTRDPETHKLNVGDLREPALAQVGRWLVTEKIDGTNIRLECAYEGDFDYVGSGTAGGAVGSYSIYLKGRSDEANLPKKFEEEALPEDWQARLITALHALCGPDPGWKLIVYGEGYGPGIQKVGGSYATHKSLRIFDCVTQRQLDEDTYGKPYWRPWADVEKVADALGLETAPLLGTDWTLDKVVGYVAAGQGSDLAEWEGGVPFGEFQAEGVIARTNPYLFFWDGKPVKFKLKGHDLPEPDTVEEG